MSIYICVHMCTRGEVHAYIILSNIYIHICGSPLLSQDRSPLTCQSTLKGVPYESSYIMSSSRNGMHIPNTNQFFFASLIFPRAFDKSGIYRAAAYHVTGW